MRALLVNLLGCLALGALLASEPSAQSRARASTGAPAWNVLLIVLDDVGSDKLSLFDDVAAPPYARTPRLDALAQGGIRFRSFYADSLCSPTRACIQTGRYGFRTGMGANSEAWRLPDSEVLLAELLRAGLTPERAYACGAFGKWHIGRQDPAHAVGNGYERFRGTLANAYNHFDWEKIEHDEGGAPSAPIPVTTFSASVVRSDAVSWINSQTRPFFAYVAFGPPHREWRVPPLALVSAATQAELAGFPEGKEAANGVERRLFYRAMLEAVDTEIGNLIDGLDPLQLQRTMVFVVCDNGSVKDVIQAPHDSDHGKSTGFQLGIRVPMIVSGPLVAQPVPPGGHLCDRLVEAVDLWPTIGAIAGADETLAFQNAGHLPPYPLVDGRSFLPLILDPGAPGANEWVFSELFSPAGPYMTSMCLRQHLRALTDGEYKYVRTVVKEQGTPRCALPQYTHELYRLTTDPHETTNLLLGPLTAEDAAALLALRTRMDVLSSAPGRIGWR
jgi:arylsulfatase A-like enzyme